MTAPNRSRSIPAWPEDEPDSSIRPTPAPVYFDPELGVWVLTSYADIYAGLHDPALWPSSTKVDKQVQRIDPESHRQLRENTRKSLTPEKIKQWESALRMEATAAAATLSTSAPVDLLSSYVIPVCVSLAETVTSVSHSEALLLLEAAQTVSASAAEPHDSDLSEKAKDANQFLKEHFKSCPEGLGDSTFVAITQTIPCLLSNIWYALTQAPSQWKLLHDRLELVELSVDELMRCAGFLRIIGRHAIKDTQIGDMHIRKGDKLVFRLAAAHRDPKRYPCPHELLVDRAGKGILSFGAGNHSCVGAGLIRMVLASVTVPLVARFSKIEIARPIVWRRGSTFRSPESLWVRLDVS
jgi:cytochrome P450